MCQSIGREDMESGPEYGSHTSASRLGQQIYNPSTRDSKGVRGRGARLDAYGCVSIPKNRNPLTDNFYFACSFVQLSARPIAEQGVKSRGYGSRERSGRVVGARFKYFGNL